MKAGTILIAVGVGFSNQVLLAQDAKGKLEKAIESAIDAAVEAEAHRPRPKLPRGSVVFKVSGGDLKTQVLPLFLKQVGVRVLYEGPPRKLTLKLNSPIGWEEALDLVAQFTNTHVMEDRHGNLVLKATWGGKIEEEAGPKQEGDRPPPHVGPPPRRGNLRYTGRRAPQRRVRQRPARRYNPKYRPPRHNPKNRVQKYRPQKYRPQKYRPQKHRPPKTRPPKAKLKYRPPKYRPPKYRPKQYKPPRHKVQ